MCNYLYFICRSVNRYMYIQNLFCVFLKSFELFTQLLQFPLDDIRGFLEYDLI